MHNSPIRNNTLLQEAYKAGYNRALNEQGIFGPPIPGIGGGPSIKRDHLIQQRIDWSTGEIINIYANGVEEGTGRKRDGTPIETSKDDYIGPHGPPMPVM